MTYRTLPLVAAVVAACMTAAAAAAPVPPPAAPPLVLVPARQGTSAVFGYQVDANGPRGSQYLHGVVVFTRLANGRAVVTVAPETGAATAVVLAVAADGTLQAASPAPGDSLRALPQSIPPGLRALSALLATPPAGASWPVAVEAGDAVVPATLSLTARAAQHDGERTVSADGTGAITIAQVQQQAGGQRGGYSRGGGGRGAGFPGGGGMGGRRGGGSGEETTQRVPATVVLHVEASFRGSTFLGARGTEQMTPAQGDKTPSSASWSLFPT